MSQIRLIITQHIIYTLMHVFHGLVLMGWVLHYDILSEFWKCSCLHLRAQYMCDIFLCLQRSTLARGVLFSAWSFLHCKTCENDILKTNKPISMQIGTSFMWRKDMKHWTLGVRRSKVKVTQGWNRSYLWIRYLQNGWNDLTQVVHGASTRNGQLRASGQRSWL